MSGAAPAGHAVVDALQLHAVPVHRGGLGEPVHHRDRRRPVARQEQGRARHHDSVGRRLIALLEHEAVDHRVAFRNAPLLGQQPKALRRLRLRARGRRALVHRDAEHEPRHPVERMALHIVQVVGARRLVAFQPRHDVAQDVAVEHPVPAPRGHPLHPERAARLHELGDGERGPVGRVDRVRHAVALGQGAEVEAVQVHGVPCEAGVQPPPAHRVADRVAQTLRVRPGQPVDGHLEDVLIGRRPRAVRPEVDHGDDEDALVAVRRDAGGIHHDGARELRVAARPGVERRLREGAPVEVRAGSVGAEPHLAPRAGRHMDRIIRHRARPQTVHDEGASGVGGTWARAEAAGASRSAGAPSRRGGCSPAPPFPARRAGTDPGSSRGRPPRRRRARSPRCPRRRPGATPRAGSPGAARARRLRASRRASGCRSARRARSVGGDRGLRGGPGSRWSAQASNPGETASRCGRSDPVSQLARSVHGRPSFSAGRNPTPCPSWISAARRLSRF
jgi:hypothetical protein